MKTKHWIVVAFVLIGGLYVLHMYTSHGGIKAGLGGLGIGH